MWVYLNILMKIVSLQVKCVLLLQQEILFLLVPFSCNNQIVFSDCCCYMKVLFIMMLGRTSFILKKVQKFLFLS